MYTIPIKNEYLENRLNRTETALNIVDWLRQEGRWDG